MDAPACEAWHVILLEAKRADDAGPDYLWWLSTLALPLAPHVADHVLRPVFISHPEQFERSVI